jgi:transposase-like protein
MSRLSTHKRRSDSTPILAPAAFRRRVPRDTAETVEHWQRQACGDANAFNALVVHYLPLTRIHAAALKRRKPELYTDSVDELASDACLGLMEAIRAYRNAHPAGFWQFAFRPIRKAIRTAVYQRRFRGRQNAERFNVVARLRAAFVQRNGRLPSLDEMTAELAGVLPNPAFYAAGQPAFVSDSQADPAGARDLPAALADMRDRGPDARALDAETIRLAMRGLDSIDRKLFRRLLDGECASGVAASLGLSKVQATRRANGLLWVARCNAELAAHVGFEPASDVQCDASRHPKAMPVSSPAVESKRTRAAELLALGEPASRVADRIGIDESTLRRWRRSGALGVHLAEPTSGPHPADVKTRAAELLNGGASLSAAARAIGVHRATLVRWQRSGELPGTPGKVDAA